MPRMRRLPGLRKLKSNPATRDIPIVMVTALNEVGDVERRRQQADELPHQTGEQTPNSSPASDRSSDSARQTQSTTGRLGQIKKLRGRKSAAATPQPPRHRNRLPFPDPDALFSPRSPARGRLAFWFVRL